MNVRVGPRRLVARKASSQSLLLRSGIGSRAGSGASGAFTGCAGRGGAASKVSDAGLSTAGLSKAEVSDGGGDGRTRGAGASATRPARSDVCCA